MVTIEICCLQNNYTELCWPRLTLSLSFSFSPVHLEASSHQLRHTKSWEEWENTLNVLPKSTSILLFISLQLSLITNPCICNSSTWLQWFFIILCSLNQALLSTQHSCLRCWLFHGMSFLVRLLMQLRNQVTNSRRDCSVPFTFLTTVTKCLTNAI